MKITADETTIATVMGMIMFILLIIFSVYLFYNKSETGHATIGASCMSGVKYYNNIYTLAPAYQPDGSLILCEDNNK